MIPPTMHGHEFNQPLSRVVMVRKTDQRTFSKGRRGGEPLLETITRETVELFNGGRAERKYTSETRDIVTPKSSRFDHFSIIDIKYYGHKWYNEQHLKYITSKIKMHFTVIKSLKLHRSASSDLHDDKLFFNGNYVLITGLLPFFSQKHKSREEWIKTVT